MKLLTLITTLSLLSITTLPSLAVGSNPKSQPQQTNSTSPKYRVIQLAPGYNQVNLYQYSDNKSEVLMIFYGSEIVQEIETKGTMMKIKFEKLEGWIQLR